MTHDIRDDPILQIPGQEGSTSSKHQMNIMSQVRAMHVSENSSDHEPIIGKVIAPGWGVARVEEDTAEKAEAKTKFDWGKAGVEKRTRYKDMLHAKLKEAQLNGDILSGNSITCNDTKCKDKECLNGIDKLVDTLITTMSTCCEQTIGSKKSNIGGSKKKSKNPTGGAPKPKRTPGWSEIVKPHKDAADFWMSIWSSCGKIRSGEVYNIMKKTKNLYHIMIRRVKRLESYITNCKMVDGSAKNEDIIKTIKDSRKLKNKTTNNVDGQSGSKVASLFAKKYEDLFNSVDDVVEMEKVKAELEEKIDNSDKKALSLITEDLVIDAISRLKSSKSDPCTSLSTDCFKGAPYILSSALVQLFKACITHNYIPGEVLVAKIIPLLKDENGDVCSADNYRSIALSSIFLKIWDWMVIILYGEKLQSDELQFGFQKWSGTEVCTWTLLETIDYYIQRGSKAYVMFMDCSKAFDKVIHSRLFRKLMAAEVDPLVIRMLVFMYRNQSGIVSWDGFESRAFSILNGVRQGAVLSPILFNLYTSDLFGILQKGPGARIRGIYYGLFGYADDLALVCNTVGGLQIMLDATSSYAADHNIMFSTNAVIEKSKTKGMIFGGVCGSGQRAHRVFKNVTLAGTTATACCRSSGMHTRGSNKR